MKRGLFALLWLFIILVVLYITLARGLILWVQQSPERLVELAHEWFDISIQYDHLKVEQTLAGFELSAYGLRFEYPKGVASINQLEMDINLLSWLWPSIPYGERLLIDGATFKLTESSAASELNPQGLYASITQFWRHIQVKNFHIESVKSEHVLAIDSLTANLADRWVLLADISIQTPQLKKWAEFDFSANFHHDPLFGIENGAFRIKQKSAIQVKDLSQSLRQEFEWVDRFPEGQFDFSLTGDVKQYQLKDLRIHLNLNQLDWNSKSPLPKEVRLLLQWQGTDQATRTEQSKLTLAQVELNQQAVDDFLPISISKTSQGLHLSIQQLGLLPFADLIAHFSDLPLNGFQDVRIEDSYALLDWSEKFFKSVNFNFTDLIWKDANHRVQVDKLNLHKTSESLVFELASPIEFETSFTERNQHVISLNQPLKLRFSKGQSNWVMDSTSILINESSINVQGEGDLEGFVDIAFDGKISNMQVLKTQFLPYKLMRPQLSDWLRMALVAGDNIQLSGLLKGRLQDFPFENNEGEFYARASVQNTELRYDPDWPSVKDFNALVEFKPFDLSIQSAAAKIYGADARDIQLNINNLAGKDIAVELTAKVFTEAQNGLNFLLASPLANRIGIEQFVSKSLSAKGDWVVNIDRLFIPVHGFDEQKTEVQGKLVLSGSAKLFNQLSIENINGALAFTRDEIWSNDNLKFRSYDGEHSVAVKTLKDQQMVTLSVNGALNLNQWYGLSGQLTHKTNIMIPTDKQQGQGVSLNANILPEAIYSEWPSPLDHKTLTQPTTLELHADEQQTTLRVLTGKLLDANFAWRLDEQKDKRLDAVWIGLNSSDEVALEKGLRFSGYAENIKLDSWIELWPEINKLAKQNTNNISKLDWLPSHFRVEAIEFMGQAYPQIELEWFSIAQELTLSAQSSYAKFDLKKLADNEAGIDINIDLLKLKTREGDQQSWLSEKTEHLKCLEPIQQEHWPNIRLRGQNILIGHRLLDHLSFNLEDSTSDRVIKNIQVEFASRSGQGEGHYLWQKETNNSQLIIKLKSQNVAALSEFIGFKKGFNGDKGEFNTELIWAGGLECLHTKSIKGDFSARFESGSIEQVEPGLARLIGLLSVDSIVRRLKLDLKDVTNKGMEYDDIKVVGSINQASVMIESLKLNSPGVKVAMRGGIGLENQNLDLRAQVTPSMGSALPTLAGIIGFANPITGILSYVIAKNLPFINEDIISYDYHISGDWIEPKVESKGGSILFKDPSAN